MMKFVGGDPLWRAPDNTHVLGRDVFEGVVEITEVARPARASNEVL